MSPAHDLFVTYCSARKSRASGLLPARLRYQSARIADVRARAAKEAASFCVLSGRYGLVREEDPLPWYDHLLREDLVPGLAVRVEGQLRQCAVTRVVYFTQPVSHSPNVQPYLSTVRLACERLSLDIEIRKLSGVRVGTSNQQIMRKAEACKRTLIVDRVAGEECFSALLAAHPGDGMVYLKRGEALEFHKDFPLALKDFELAVALLWDGSWQDQARSGADRALRQINAGPAQVEPVPPPQDIDYRFMGEVYNGLQRILDSIEGGRGEDRGMDGRISRLRDEAFIPPATANNMHSLRIARNQATKDNVVFRGPDAEAILASWRAVREWAAANGDAAGDVETN